jgi:hypothetical protein
VLIVTQSSYVVVLQAVNSAGKLPTCVPSALRKTKVVDVEIRPVHVGAVKVYKFELVPEPYK